MASAPALTPVEATPPTLDDLQTMAAALEERMKKECDDLRSMLEGEQEIANQIQGILDASNERAKRIRRALAALEGTSSPAATTAATKQAKSKGWQVSDERVEFVLGLFRAEPEPITPTQLAEKTEGISIETVGKAVEVLRGRELVRRVAKVRGGGWTYAVMPEVADAA
jgi:DNA-binding transcriptional regulator GbsR (MarR family)